MGLSRLLIANRGEVAVRIMRTASEMGITTIAVYSQDDAECLHAMKADESVPLAGSGPAAYLDIDALVAVALASKCDAVHPGWGFLSENAAFADACRAAGLIFVGPAGDTLRAVGDKTRARRLARENGVPVLHGSDGPVTLEKAHDFLRGLGSGGAAMLKAVAGGGGRGMRLVTSAEELETAYARCQSEAARAFGDGSVYVEEAMPRARHIEVQIAG
ncbi:MAG: biotin carboxylase N-terminal domain-containing protein, partial [Gammaproteobacteria bacterium]